MTTVSRAEYLKKYTSSNYNDKKLSTKKNTSTKSSTKNKKTTTNFRLLEEDTFIKNKPGTSKKYSDDDDFEEEDFDDIEKAIRLLNKKAGVTNSKNKKEKDVATFKSDGFVVIQGSPEDDDSTNKKSTSDEIEIKKEIKEEINEEDFIRDEPSKKKRKMDDGRQAGLLTKEIAREEYHKMRERDKKEKSQVDEQGRDAETRKRVTGFDKGRKRRKEEDENIQEKKAREEREAAKQAEMEKKYLLWNKGMTQINERKEKLDEMEQTLNEGFTRLKDDEELNKHLKEQLHSEDPMAEYFKIKNHKIKMKTGIVYPTYKGQSLPNRYEIPPGYRWDGVDRSNGFEAKMSMEKNKKMAQKELTYRSIAECE